LTRRAPRSEHHHHHYGFGDGFFFSVSPFAVTAEEEVGEVLVTFGPSVERPLESVTPDCDWFGAAPLRELPLSPIFEPPLVLELRFMLELSDMLEPLLIPVLGLLLMEPVLSAEAGATAPPAVDVSVVLALLPLLHAATAIRVARIAMRFMKSSVEIITRERCATFSASMHSSTRASSGQ
jgi:hypothetical protein